MIRRRPRRRLALASGLLFWAAQLAALAHQARAHHGYCSEHGRLIHLDPAQAPAVPDRTHRGVGRASHLDGTHGCPALTLLSTPGVAPRGDRGVACSDVAAPATRRDAPAPARPIAPLRLAPKGSPPAP